MYARATLISMTMTLALLAACGNDDGGATKGATAGDGGAASSSSSTGGSVASCTEADLAKCDYPQRKLAFKEQGGINIPEANTARTVPVLARIPEGAGPFPVVIWSHGGGFNAQGHVLLGKDWATAFAEQGYVALTLGHPPFTKEAGEYLCAVGKIPAAECSTDAAADEDSALVGMLKQLDILAVLDKLKTLSDESVGRGGPALDLTKVIAAGWSAGARGPLLIMGSKLKTTPSAPIYARPDSRVAAVIALSPAGPGFGGYYDDGTETSWSQLRGPVFIGTGDNDVKVNKPELTGPIRRFPFSAQPADGTRRLLYSKLPVGVGGHDTFNLADAASPDQRLSRLSRALRSSVLAFLDANVKTDATAKDWLATSNAKVLAGDADWESR